MGSWSVYCGISNITITSGTDCVLLPLIKRSLVTEGRDTYHYTLPIFGKYNDYGGIMDIERDEFTEVIEKAHSVDIQKFCDALTDGFREKIHPLPGIDYMWMNREVYDFMVSYHPSGYNRLGYLVMGDPAFLKYIGAIYIGTDDNRKRFKHIWELAGKNFFSDGSSLQTENNESIFKVSDLKKFSPDLDYSVIEKMERQHDYIYKKDIEYRYENYKHMMGWPKYLMESGYRIAKLLQPEEFVTLGPESFLAKYIENSIKDNEIDLISAEYTKILSNDNFCSKLADLSTLYMNMFTGSYLLKPFQNFLTPQGGDHLQHQVILEKFCQINKSNIYEKED